MEQQLPSNSKSFDLVEDCQDFLIVHKHAGISFHNEDEVDGLSSVVKNHFHQYELYPVHRLDKVTSGLVIFAKSSKAADSFRRLFETHQIEKTYLALSDRKPKKKQGLVVGDMEKSRRGAWKLCHTKINPAKTYFQSAFCEQKNLRLFHLKPLTGKTHQLRVMMKSLGSPILGDSLYSGTSAERCFLHAYQLKFEWNSRQYRFETLPLWPCLQLVEHFLA